MQNDNVKLTNLFAIPNLSRDLIRSFGFAQDGKECRFYILIYHSDFCILV